MVFACTTTNFPINRYKQCYCCRVGAFNALLRELVAEFTLTDNPANTTASLLRSVCHADDSVILGSWLQETDHKAIEDQVGGGGHPCLFSFSWVMVKTFHWWCHVHNYPFCSFISFLFLAPDKWPTKV